MPDHTPTEQQSYAVKAAIRQGVTRDLPHGPDDHKWVASSATLIYGECDAVLVDTFTSIDQNTKLVEWVKSFDRTRTHLFITHGHGDHLFGIGQLLDQFPSALPIGTAETGADAQINYTPEWRQGFGEHLNAWTSHLLLSESDQPEHDEGEAEGT